MNSELALNKRLVDRRGVEPLTFAVQMQRSTNWAIGPIVCTPIESEYETSAYIVFFKVYCGS